MSQFWETCSSCIQQDLPLQLACFIVRGGGCSLGCWARQLDVNGDLAEESNEQLFRSVTLSLFDREFSNIILRLYIYIYATPLMYPRFVLELCGMVVVSLQTFPISTILRHMQRTLKY